MDLTWSKLSRLQLGRYAEYYAAMEFTSYGFDVYTSEVDDHGVDFVIKAKDGTFYEIQVKAVRSPFVSIRKDKIVLNDHFLICYLRFQDGATPDVFVFPSSVWESPNELFGSNDYIKPDQISKPEYTIKYSKKNAHLLEPYRIESYLNQLNQKC